MSLYLANVYTTVNCTRIMRALSYLGFLSKCTMAASVLNTVAFKSYNKNTAGHNNNSAWNTNIKLLHNCHIPMPPASIRVKQTYSEVYVFQLQDVDQFFNEPSIQDRVQMFLSRVRVNYNNSFYNFSTTFLATTENINKIKMKSWWAQDTG